MADVLNRLGGARSTLGMKEPCRVATTANITLSGLQTIDGVALAEGDRVLVKNQTDATLNGIRVAATSSWARAKDWDGNTDIVQGTQVYVATGALGVGTYALASADPIEIGTDNLAFVREPGSISITTVDNTVARFNGTTGELQGSGVTIDDSNNISWSGKITQARIGGIWTDTAAFKNFTVTISIATPAVISWTAHGFSAGQRVQFTTTGSLPTGITASTTYFVLASGLTANAFQISATDGGAAINTTGSQSGVHSGHIIGVNIARFERVFIGDAVNNDGTLVGSQGSVWLDAYDGLIVTSSDLAVVSRSGLAAAVFAVRTSDRPTGASNAIAGSFYAVNDNTAVAQVAFGVYIEAFRPIGGGTIHAMEMDATEFGTANSVLPYTSNFAGVSSGLWVASGGGNEVGTTDASIAIHIVNNNSKWKTGITFDGDGITGTDGVTGTGEAIAFAKGHKQNWYYAGNNVGFSLYSDVAASGDKQTALIDTNGVSFLNNSDLKNFRVAKVSGTLTANLAVLGSTGGTPSLIAEGSATNASISITPKGTGSIFLDAAIISTGLAASTGDVGLELGGNRTGAGNAYIDFHATSGSDFEARVFRNSGANGSFQFTNSGTGSIQFSGAAGSVTQFIINSAEDFRSDGGGINLATGKTLRVNGVQLLSARDTGWGAVPTATLLKTTFANGGVTTFPQVEQRLAAIITALQNNGIIGT